MPVMTRGEYDIFHPDAPKAERRPGPSPRGGPRRRVLADDRHMPFHPAFFRHLLDGLRMLPFRFAQVVQAQVDNNTGHPGAKTRFPVELVQPLPAFYPCFLGKINRFFLIPHHGEGPSVYLVAVPGDQLLESVHLAALRRSHQLLVLC